MKIHKVIVMLVPVDENDPDAPKGPQQLIYEDRAWRFLNKAEVYHRDIKLMDQIRGSVHAYNGDLR